MEILQKTTSEIDSKIGEQLDTNVGQDAGVSSVENGSSLNGESVMGEKLETIAEEKLVSFCGQVLKEASDFQSSMGETTNMNIHQVLELRSPVIVKVLIAALYPQRVNSRKLLKRLLNLTSLRFLNYLYVILMPGRTILTMECFKFRDFRKFKEMIWIPESNRDTTSDLTANEVVHWGFWLDKVA